MRPFLLYHWSPVERRKSILRHGLKPGCISRDREWRPPYVCFCRFPGAAWRLSATHSDQPGAWDLWCVWSDAAGKYSTLNTSRNPKVAWWRTEYRCFHRIPKSKVWHVGTKEFAPRRARQTPTKSP